MNTIQCAMNFFLTFISVGSVGRKYDCNLKKIPVANDKMMSTDRRWRTIALVTGYSKWEYSLIVRFSVKGVAEKTAVLILGVYELEIVTNRVLHRLETWLLRIQQFVPLRVVGTNLGVHDRTFKLIIAFKVNDSRDIWPCNFLARHNRLLSEPRQLQGENPIGRDETFVLVSPLRDRRLCIANTCKQYY
ncbi:hypothetical protein RB1194 [Rhodopirellula baltica SH 1]|uniref:Uncharacterized protein n=1 Tax=Rhodopirellula baltica (strain DSM 10527 / NCIMB 13988 / SH1) TaxID=243090 RepID=Q7UXQ1_RHOBA|nr:hypothetical protein RB1194 [Rhodopirellula baltica SH 1]